jgi:hypothetical protein
MEQLHTIILFRLPLPAERVGPWFGWMRLQMPNIIRETSKKVKGKSKKFKGNLETGDKNQDKR